jgi:phage head maturation protease
MDSMAMKRVFYPIVRGETVGDVRYATITTDDLDRQGEILDPDGMDFTNFMANGVVLYGHQYSGIESIPVGKVHSLSLVHENTRKKMDMGWVFQGDDVTPLITAVTKSWDRGFLNTVSVGFMAKEYDGNIITKSELLEVSIVPVPANPQALRLNGFTDAEVKALTPEVTPADLIADLEALVDVKEGRVLSTKNYALVSQCVDSLTALLAASDKSSSGDEQSDEGKAWLEALHKSVCKT